MAWTSECPLRNRDAQPGHGHDESGFVCDGRRSLVRHGAFTFPVLGPAASLRLHDCVGSVQRVRYTCTEDEDYTINARPGAQRSLSEYR